MTRPRNPQKNRKKPSAKQQATALAKQNPDYRSRRFIGRFGTALCHYIDLVEENYVRLLSDYTILADAHEHKPLQTRVDHYVQFFGHLNIMPDNTERWASIRHVFEELEAGRMGGQMESYENMLARQAARQAKKAKAKSALG